MRAYLVILALAVAIPASAQESSTTRCRPDFVPGSLSCDTTTRRDPYRDAYAETLEAHRQRHESDDRTMENMRALVAAREARDRAEQEAKLQSQLAQTVRAGRCKEARSMALDAGRLDLAETVMRVCLPPAQ